MAHWLQDSDLAGVRGETASAKLPAEEQSAWRQLWADVRNTLTRTQAETNGKEKSV